MVSCKCKIKAIYQLMIKSYIGLDKSNNIFSFQGDIPILCVYVFMHLLIHMGCIMNYKKYTLPRMRALNQAACNPISLTMLPGLSHTHSCG